MNNKIILIIANISLVIFISLLVSAATRTKTKEKDIEFANAVSKEGLIEEELKRLNEESIKEEEEMKKTIKKCKISEDMAIDKAMEEVNKEYNLNLTKENLEGTRPVKEIIEKIAGETNKYESVLSWYVYFENGDDFYNCCINAETGEVLKMMFCKPDGTYEVPERFKHTLDFPRVS